MMGFEDAREDREVFQIRPEVLGDLKQTHALGKQMHALFKQMHALFRQMHALFERAALCAAPEVRALTDPHGLSSFGR